MSLTLNHYITTLDMTLLVFSGWGSDVSLFSVTTVIGTPVWVVSDSISKVFLVTNGIVKVILKTMVWETNQQGQIALLARKKLIQHRKRNIQSTDRFWY